MQSKVQAVKWWVHCAVSFLNLKSILQVMSRCSEVHADTQFHPPTELKTLLEHRITDKFWQLTVSVQSVHSSKWLLTSVTDERAIIGVKLLMPFTIMLSSKAFSTTRPLAYKRFLLVMRSYMT